VSFSKSAGLETQPYQLGRGAAAPEIPSTFNFQPSTFLSPLLCGLCVLGARCIPDLARGRGGLLGVRLEARASLEIGLALTFSAYRISSPGTMNVCEFPCLDFLEEDPDLQLAMLFGSAAAGHLRPDSDIDIAIYPRRSMSPRKRQQVADQIALATNRAVDLIDLSTAEGALLRQILHSGIVLFSKDYGLLGSLSERLLDWQENFEPQLNALLEARLHRLTLPIHGS